MKSTPQVQLKRYRWKGVNNSGKKISGEELALTEVEVRDKLKAQHIQINKIKKSSPGSFAQIKHRIKTRDITVFTRQMATMLNTGVPILMAIKLVGDNHKKAQMKSILAGVAKAIESGTPLSKALAVHKKYFDTLYIDLIATGEQSGNLADVFERLAEYREKSEQLKAKVIKAMIYPAMVMLVALGVSYLMLTMVIPEFAAMFEGYGAELPWFTRQVLAISDWVQEFGHYAILSIVLLIIFSRWYRDKSHSFALFLDRNSLKMPVLGSVLSKAAIAKFTRTLATNFAAGIPLLTGLKTTSRTSGNLHYQLAIDSVYKDTAAGMPMYIAMRNSDVFPELVIQMVMIGEESGQLDDMLNKIATIYEFEVDNTVDNLSKILEPLIIVFLGVVVGGLVTAMYLPIFNLMSVIG